jgi:serine/threonine protein phosphatase PrpC
MLKEEIDGKTSKSNKMKNIEKAILKAHKITNETMIADTSIETALSGTTAITVLFKDKTMFVSNVGDSRAILVSDGGDGLKISPLSSDHTPYRKDERFRVMKYGARVLSAEQLASNDPGHQNNTDNWADITLGDELDEAGDPPRVWAQDGEYPGTAFTRSIGDSIAEELGVTAEPEILVRDIKSNDKFIVIASDGVFEFLTNQMVAEIVADTEDPLKACHAVVAAAYDLWLRFDVRTDDITIIVLQFMDFISSPISIEEIKMENILQSQCLSSAAIFGSPQPPPVNPSARILNDSRPVRRKISREKKRKMIFTPHLWEKTGHKDEECQIKELPPSLPKNEHDTAVILHALKLNFLFQYLNNVQRIEIVNYLKPMSVLAGDMVIKQGIISFCSALNVIHS